VEGSCRHSAACSGIRTAPVAVLPKSKTTVRVLLRTNTFDPAHRRRGSAFITPRRQVPRAPPASRRGHSPIWFGVSLGAVVEITPTVGLALVLPVGDDHRSACAGLRSRAALVR